MLGPLSLSLAHARPFLSLARPHLSLSLSRSCPFLSLSSQAIAAVKPIRAVAGNLPEEVTSVFINAGDGVIKLSNDGAVKG